MTFWVWVPSASCHAGSCSARQRALRLSVTPSVTTATGLVWSERGDPVPTVTVRETDTVLRVRDGETAVLTGWLHRVEPVVRAVPDTQTAVETASALATRLTELVILLTPTVIDGV